MIRSGQMIFFQALVTINNIKEHDELLALFNDNKDESQSPFSIRNIVSKASDEFNLEPGSWFRSTTIMMTLETLNNTYPTKFTKNIDMVTFVDSVIVYEEIYKRAFGKAFSENKSHKKEGHCIEALCHQKWDKYILVNIACRLGLDKPAPNYELCFKKLLSLENCLGVLGGQENSAYYIIGFDNKQKYYYLDPHYTQEVKNGSKDDLESYFKQKTISE